MELVVEKVTRRLISIFNNFILDVEYPNNVDDRILKLIPQSHFLNFNYTDTLERYYRVDGKRICYIHEKSSKDDCKIILGHGTDPSSFDVKAPQPPEGLNEEELEQWREDMADQYDYSYESAKNEILSYYTRAFKNTTSIIEKNIHFLEGLRKVENIYVLGHSISKVDIKYFEAVRKYAPEGTTWHITYYSDQEKQKHFTTLTEIGIKPEELIQLKMTGLR